MDESVIEIKNLTKKFDDLIAVNNLSFIIKKGEILGLLGPNGSGKTTTINMLLRLIKPTYGEIKIFGLSFDKNREKILKQVNFSAAYVNLLWRLKVFENLYTFARLYEVENYREKVDKLLEKFKIKDQKNRRTDELSSGQLARLYLCKAFINNPKLLLLDEPTVFLDPNIADFTRKFIVKKVRQEETTVLFTSHNMDEATEMCDQVMFLHYGRVIGEDTLEGLAQKIKSCQVRLLFIVPKERVKTILSNYQYKFWEEDRELIIEVEEEKIEQLLGRLSLAKLKYSQTPITYVFNKAGDLFFGNYQNQ